MSYRDPKQSLEGPITKILEGIEEFNEAVKKRFESNDWEDGHLMDLKAATERLFHLRYDLIKIRKETW